jgi:hypothetical protein
MMDLREALREQYHAGLAMLAECVEKCPDDLWRAGEHPRAYWRIVWHTLYFTHIYLVQDTAAFEASVPGWPPAVRERLGVGGTQNAIDVEPYELPEGVEPLTPRDLLDYLGYLRGLVDPTIDGLDLDRPDTGFPWYDNMSKLSHELMNLRHIQGHIGQLSELLMIRNIDIEWVGKG